MFVGISLFIPTSAISIFICSALISDITEICEDKFAICISSGGFISIIPLDMVFTIDVASNEPICTTLTLFITSGAITGLISMISGCCAITRSDSVKDRLKSSIIVPNCPCQSPASSPNTFTLTVVLFMLNSFSNSISKVEVITPSL